MNWEWENAHLVPQESKIFSWMILYFCLPEVRTVSHLFRGTTMSFGCSRMFALQSLPLADARYSPLSEEYRNHLHRPPNSQSMRKMRFVSSWMILEKNASLAISCLPMLWTLPSQRIPVAQALQIPFERMMSSRLRELIVGSPWLDFPTDIFSKNYWMSQRIASAMGSSLRI